MPAAAPAALRVPLAVAISAVAISAVAAAVTSKNDEIVARDRQIAELNIKLRETAKDTLVKEQSLKENYELKLKEKDTQIEFYKDLKAKMSTKAGKASGGRSF